MENNVTIDITRRFYEAFSRKFKKEKESVILKKKKNNITWTVFRKFVKNTENNIYIQPNEMYELIKQN